jgi:hypothetical protein
MQSGVQKLEQISVNLDQQSTLARLLAKENISVIHGSYRTAWFDPQKRVLALPIWKNRGKAVYDMLTGHEVGHALYTPAKGWHDAIDDIKGAPKAYLNILEDVRIERKVQDLYPGLRFQFQKAYKNLAEDDFFGIVKDNIDIDAARVIDKINVKAKLGPNIQVDFKPIEFEFFARSFETETFDDVVALAKEIYEYQKSLMKKVKVPPTITLPTFDIPPDEEMMQEDSSEYEKPEEEDTPLEQPQELLQDEEKPEEEEVEKEDEKPKNGKTGTGTDGIQEEADKDDIKDGPSSKDETEEEPDPIDLESLTDKAFRDKESELVAASEMKGTMLYNINKIRQPEIVIDYKEYYNEWKRHLGEMDPYYSDTLKRQLPELDDNYKRFRTDTDMAAAYMAKEFELRKAAYQYSRSSVQKTGIINTNKLHAYKYSEDIFLKSTKLANYKNHGMMMFIDFSGSMQNNIGATIRQLLNLTTFCRMVQIPFEVYAFTTRVRADKDGDDVKYDEYCDSEIIPQKFNLLNMMSSRMTRSEYNEASRMLWNLSMAWDSKLNQRYINSWNHLHSTPLNTCIVYAEELIAKFKSKHNVEKMTAMFLTDGESDSFQIRMTEEGDAHRTEKDSYYSYRGKPAIVRLNGKSIHVKAVNSADMTEGLLRHLKTSTNTNVLGFFISDYRNQAVAKATSEAPVGKYGQFRDKYTEQMNKNRCLIEDGIFGYDRYFGLCAKYMDVTENEFGDMVEDGASKNKIKTAFAKMSKSKRVNRILLNAFVDAIA